MKKDSQQMGQQKKKKQPLVCVDNGVYCVSPSPKWNIIMHFYSLMPFYDVPPNWRLAYNV